MAKIKEKRRARLYSVLITRDRTLSESVELEVSALNPEEAERMALERAEQLGSEEWSVDDESIGTLCAEVEEPDEPAAK